MQDKISGAFWAGYRDGGECFSPGNPYIPTSDCHLSFEAGRMACGDFPEAAIKSVHKSRGFTFRIETVNGRVMYAANYDRRWIMRTE